MSKNKPVKHKVHSYIRLCRDNIKHKVKAHYRGGK